MWKIVAVAVLAGLVSGCVTQDGPTAQRSSPARSAGVQTPQNADRAAAQQSARAPIIIGAAY
jgi:hypothetical protein